MGIDFFSSGNTKCFTGIVDFFFLSGNTKCFTDIADFFFDFFLGGGGGGVEGDTKYTYSWLFSGNTKCFTSIVDFILVMQNAPQFVFFSSTVTSFAKHRYELHILAPTPMIPTSVFCMQMT